MRVATTEEIGVFELLTVELEFSTAVSVVGIETSGIETSVAVLDRDRPVVALEWAVGRDRALVLDEAPLLGPGISRRFSVSRESGGQADL